MIVGLFLLKFDFVDLFVLCYVLVVWFKNCLFDLGEFLVEYGLFINEWWNLVCFVCFCLLVFGWDMLVFFIYLVLFVFFLYLSFELMSNDDLLVMLMVGFELLFDMLGVLFMGEWFCFIELYVYGGFGEVYFVKDLELNWEVVFKCIWFLIVLCLIF